MPRRKSVDMSTVNIRVVDEVVDPSDSVYDIFKGDKIETVEPIIIEDESDQLDLDSFNNFDESKLVSWTSEDGTKGCTGKIEE